MIGLVVSEFVGRRCIRSASARHPLGVSAAGVSHAAGGVCFQLHLYRRRYICPDVTRKRTPPPPCDTPVRDTPTKADARLQNGPTVPTLECHCGGSSRGGAAWRGCRAGGHAAVARRRPRGAAR